MFGKLTAILVMGVVVGVLAAFDLAFATSSPHATVGGLVGGFVLVAVLAFSASGGRGAWRRSCVLAGLLCLALPLATLVHSVVTTTQIVAQAGPRETDQTAAALGAGLGAMMATGTAAFVGFFGAAIFLVSALFLREPRIIVHQQSSK
jgi:hypothetical protein